MHAGEHDFLATIQQIPLVQERIQRKRAPQFMSRYQMQATHRAGRRNLERRCGVGPGVVTVRADQRRGCRDPDRRDGIEQAHEVKSHGDGAQTVTGASGDFRIQATQPHEPVGKDPRLHRTAREAEQGKIERRYLSPIHALALAIDRHEGCQRFVQLFERVGKGRFQIPASAE